MRCGWRPLFGAFHLMLVSVEGYDSDLGAFSIRGDGGNPLECDLSLIFTSTLTFREPPAKTSTSSSSIAGRSSKASGWWERVISPIRSGFRSCARNWCQRNPACSRFVRKSPGLSTIRFPPHAEERSASCYRLRSAASTSARTEFEKFTTWSMRRPSRLRRRLRPSCRESGTSSPTDVQSWELIPGTCWKSCSRRPRMLS